ncbi:lanthionine synthetase C family protein [Nonomuraea rubra]|uniref:lanthionine synthetase C family protein n=1 Tax=Nonomuraea rubra TaxID=46180 RepID=UPI0033F78E2A
MTTRGGGGGVRAAMTARVVAEIVAGRSADPVRLAEAVRAGARQSRYAGLLPWREAGLAMGRAGIAVLCAEMDRRRPGRGWDRAGHEHLAAAAASATPYDLSLFSGLSGIGLAAILLASGRPRYRRLLAAVDATLAPAVERASSKLATANGCAASDFDLVSGLTGMGTYLLARHQLTGDPALLSQALSGLVPLLASEDRPRRWHTPADLATGSLRETYPRGHLNCGLAHGAPGPMALLSLALLEGVEVSGSRAAIEATATWLTAHRSGTATDPDWPDAIPLDAPDPAPPDPAPTRPAPTRPAPTRPASAGPSSTGHSSGAQTPCRPPSTGSPSTGSPSGVASSGVASSLVASTVQGAVGRASAESAPGRAAWCYGAPGVARGLWLAGTALDRPDWRELAARTIRAVAARPPEAWWLSTPAFCHGRAGLLQVLRRFAADLADPALAATAEILAADLAAEYDPDSVLGLRSVEPEGTLVDHPGLLDGAPGVALALLGLPPPHDGPPNDGPPHDGPPSAGAGPHAAGDASPSAGGSRPGAQWDRMFLLS